MKKLSSFFITLFLLLWAFLPAFPTAALEADLTGQPHRLVRVGFFPFEGYYAIDSGGQRSGYGYELMQLMALHANWSYEYIDTVQTWSELEQMLLDGQIDMLTSVQKTPANSSRFAFSSLPISMSSTLLTVRAGNTAFISGDYSTYDGARIGMMRSNSHNADLAHLSEEKGFSYRPVYFDSLDALLQALQEGTAIDAAVTSSLRPIHNEWILEQFAPAPFYLIVRRDDFTLQEEMDNSLRQLSTYSPNWQSDLYHKYYTPDNGANLYLSAEERHYIEDLKAHNHVFKVAVNPDNAPCSYFVNGQAQGIIPDIFAETARRAGICYEVVVTSSRQEYEDLIRSGSVDLVMDASHDYSQAEQLGYKLSKPYLDLFGAFLVRRNSNGWLQTIAIPKTLQIQTLRRSHLLDGRETEDFPSANAAVQAVLDGSCDGALLYMFTAQKYIHDDDQGRLQLSLLPKFHVALGIAAAQALDYRLLSILSKSAESVKNNYARHIVLKHTTLEPAPMSVQRYVHENPLPALAILAVIAFFVFFGLLTSQRMRTVRKERQRKQELEDFLSYVCRSNDMVIEVDPWTKICCRYSLKDGHVDIQRHVEPCQDYLSVVHPHDLQLLQRHMKPSALKALIDQRGEAYAECRCRDAAGQYHWYAHVLQGIGPSRRHPKGGFILFRRNIHQTKQAVVEALAAARQANKAKGAFLSQMSHEIRTPLNAIIGYLTILQRPGLEEQRTCQCLNNGMTAAQQLLSLINDILDMSSIESGRMKIANAPFQLAPLLEETAALFQDQAREKKVTFKTALPVGPSITVIGDRLRVRQILSNLLSNAIKFTPAGGTVSLRTTLLHQGEKRLVGKFEIEDTGIGMSPDFLRRLFQPFEQESAETAQRFGGTGLGLSITNNLVHMLQGSIEVKSIQGKGSVFTVTLPFMTAPTDSIKAEAEAASLPQTACRLSLLLVEDNEMNRDIERTLLEEAGHQIDAAVNGQEAVDRFIHSAPGTYMAILMDLQMPVLNGYDAAKAIRSSDHPQSQTIPIIAVSADVLPEDMARAMACGMNDYISKPIDYTNLMNHLSKFL